MAKSSTTRILDAAMNRTNEGLRVIEDFVRFVLNDEHLTTLLKQLRHQLGVASTTLPAAVRHAARDTPCDVGTHITTINETTRADNWDVCRASCERVKQSLRSLEEYSKISSPDLATKLEAIRYQFYTIERSLTSTYTNCLNFQDTHFCTLIDGRDSIEAFSELVRQLLDAGVPMVQLRDKKLSDALLLERAKILVKFVRNHTSTPPPDSPHVSNTLVIVNDRADIAAAADADGVHVGQEDLSVHDARSIVGPHKLIGVSTHTLEQARTAVLAGANYLGAGPTFQSTTKVFEEFPGLELLRLLATEIRLPTFAIGGINAKNLPEVLATGTQRIAVSGAVASAKCPAEVARGFLKTLSNLPY